MAPKTKTEREPVVAVPRTMLIKKLESERIKLEREKRDLPKTLKASVDKNNAKLEGIKLAEIERVREAAIKIFNMSDKVLASYLWDEQGYGRYCELRSKILKTDPQDIRPEKVDLADQIHHINGRLTRITYRLNALLASEKKSISMKSSTMNDYVKGIFLR